MIISGQYTAQVRMGDNQRTIHGMMDMDMDMDMDIGMDMDMGMDNGFPTMRVSSRCCAAMLMAIQAHGTHGNQRPKHIYISPPGAAPGAARVWARPEVRDTWGCTA